MEKMLYDNAQLAAVYLEAYQATNNKEFRDVAAEVLDYLLRDMVAPEGGFYSASDAENADWIFCLVRTNSDVQKQKGISFLLIDMKSH